MGGIALTSMLGLDRLEGVGPGPILGQPHHPAKAKRVVQLFMAGAASHIDLFDYKPALIKHHVVRDFRNASSPNAASQT